MQNDTPATRTLTDKEKAEIRFSSSRAWPEMTPREARTLLGLPCETIIDFPGLEGRSVRRFSDNTLSQATLWAHAGGLGRLLRGSEFVPESGQTFFYVLEADIRKYAGLPFTDPVIPEPGMARADVAALKMDRQFADGLNLMLRRYGAKNNNAITLTGSDLKVIFPSLNLDEILVRLKEALGEKKITKIATNFIIAPGALHKPRQTATP